MADERNAADVDDEYPEILADLFGKFTAAIETWGAGVDAQVRAFELVEIIRRDWKGQQVYISKGQSYEISQRDAEIYARFNGANAADLARQYELTERQIRTIIARVRAADLRKRQGGLF